MWSAASTDPISMLGQLDSLSQYVNRGNLAGQLQGLAVGLGTDPAGDGFGSVRFRAEVPNSDGINPTTTPITTTGAARRCAAWPTSPPVTATR